MSASDLIIGILHITNIHMIFFSQLHNFSKFRIWCMFVVPGIENKVLSWNKEDYIVDAVV